MSEEDWQMGYNGFRWKKGYSTIPIQNDALRRGLIIRPTMCGICRDGRTDRPKGRDYRYLHVEDYSRPLVIHPCCKSCHAALHARFRDPERWQRLLARHGRPGDWATLLSLDPASQQRPFAETYPNGLPPPPSPMEAVQRSLFDGADFEVIQTIPARTSTRTNGPDLTTQPPRAKAGPDNRRHDLLRSG